MTARHDGAGMTARPWSVIADGVILNVRLTPKGGRDTIEGAAHGSDGRPALQVRVRAAPREGEANAALVKLIARALGVPARTVTIVAGQAGRHKRIRIAGTAIALTQSLERICSDGQA